MTKARFKWHIFTRNLILKEELLHETCSNMFCDTENLKIQNISIISVDEFYYFFYCMNIHSVDGEFCLWG